MLPKSVWYNSVSNEKSEVLDMRLFKTSKMRIPVSLDGVWDFKTDPENKGITEKWYENVPAGCDRMCVPLCWNTESRYFKYEGKAWYFTTFEALDNTYVLNFDAVQKYAEVYIDGIFSGSHYGGFTGFSIEGRGKGTHTLAVMADNTHNDIDTIPLSKVDWFHYGGISGSVSVTSFCSAYISSHKVSYTLSGKKARGKINFTINGEYSGKADIIFDGKVISSIDAKTGENSVSVDFGEVELWDTDSPKLYEINIVIDCDDIIDRIGFRTVEAKGTEIYLNGKPIKLKGINRHNECPEFGFSMPFSLMKRDVDIIKELNCNIIRGSHYPNPEMLLDYLDETGMLFWEEIPMWGYPQDALSAPDTMKRGLLMHKEMVECDYHHPSIIIWGLHNEIDTTVKEAYEITKAFSELIREHDSSRLITYATFKPYTDICYEFADIISLNIYPGWYGGHNPSEEAEAIMDKTLEYLEKTNNLNKPLFISEFGAGAIYGESTFTNAKWTEQYQANLLKELILKFHNEYNVGGTFIWQYCDMYTAFEKELERPRSFNNKGLLDEYRRPKLGYYVVKDIYGKL